eukprot:9061200-Pyramimonas_sp.AAC.1
MKDALRGPRKRQVFVDRGVVSQELLEVSADRGGPVQDRGRLGRLQACRDPRFPEQDRQRRGRRYLLRSPVQAL